MAEIEAERELAQRAVVAIGYQCVFLAAVVVHLTVHGPLYRYRGYVAELSVPRLAEAMSLLALLAIVLPAVPRRPSDLLLHLHLLLPVLPMLVIWSCSGGSDGMTLATCLGFLVATGMRLLPLHLPKGPRFESGLVDVGMLAVSTAIVGALILVVGTGNISFDPMRVHAVRAVVAERLSPALVYLSSLGYAALIPATIAVGLATRRRWIVLTALVLAVVQFGVVAQWAAFLLVVVTVATWLAGRRRWAPLAMIAGLAIVLAMAELIPTWGRLGTVAMVMFDRGVFLPALINGVYHDFFVHEPLVLWSNSKIGLGLVSPRYDLPLPVVIGQYLGTNEHANTGWIGSGFMHAGWIGIMVYAGLLGVLLRLVDVLRSHIGSIAGAAAFFAAPLFLVFTSVDPPIAGLTFGLVPLLVIAWMRAPRTADRPQVVTSAPNAADATRGAPAIP